MGFNSAFKGLIVKLEASETNWFNDFQDKDTVMKLSFIEVVRV
jgi:hypothetical protein